MAISSSTELSGLGFELNSDCVKSNLRIVIITIIADNHTIRCKLSSFTCCYLWYFYSVRVFTQSELILRTDDRIEIVGEKFRFKMYSGAFVMRVQVGSFLQYLSRNGNEPICLDIKWSMSAFSPHLLFYYKLIVIRRDVFLYSEIIWFNTNYWIYYINFVM